MISYEYEELAAQFAAFCNRKICQFSQLCGSNLNLVNNQHQVTHHSSLSLFELCMLHLSVSTKSINYIDATSRFGLNIV